MKRVYGSITFDVYWDVDADSDELALLKANYDFSEPFIEEWNLMPISSDGTVHNVDVITHKVNFTNVEEDSKKD